MLLLRLPVLTLLAVVSASASTRMPPALPVIPRAVTIGAEVTPQPASEPTWVRLGPDYQIGDGLSLQVSVHPAKPAELVLATRPFGMYLSTDAGVTWKKTGTQFGADLNQGPNWGLTRAPSNPDIIYVGLENPGIWRSDDGGRTWTDRSQNLPKGRAQRGTVSAVHPQDPDTVWLGTDGGLFKSKDGGRTWKMLEKGLPTGKGKNGGDRNQTISSVLLDPRNPDVVRIGIYASGEGEPAGVWRSDDGGDTWRSTSVGIPTGHFELDKTKAGLQGLKVKPDWIHRLEQGVNAPDTLYAVTGSGFACSLDGGATWKLLPDQRIGNSLGVDPRDAQRVAVGKSDGGVLFSGDGGQTWRDLSAGLPTGKTAQAEAKAVAFTLVLPDGTKLEASGTPRSQVHGVESFTFAPQRPDLLYVSVTAGVFQIVVPAPAAKP